MKIFLMATLLVGLVLPLAAHADSAEDLLLASDRSRGGLDHGITWNIKIDSTEEGETTSRQFLVKAKKNDAYVEATQPARNKGEVYLFNERTMWFFKPSLKKPVAISARQRLSGQTANGDIANTRYSRDYTATFEKDSDVHGEKVKVLMLKAKADNLTYDRIRYFVNPKTHLAMRAEFLTLNGKPFKIGEMEYGNKVNSGGKNLPFISRLTITDAKFKDNKSVLTYTNPKVEDHPASLFNVNRLSR